MKTIQALLAVLREAGISLSVENTRLRYRAAKGIITAAQFEEIRVHKSKIIEYLERVKSLTLKSPPLVAGERPAVLPLSYAQERLWLLDQIEGLGAAYNTPAAVRLSGMLDVAALERAFGEVVRRHEILRTRFAVVDEAPMQVIEPAGEFRLVMKDMSTQPEGEREEAARRRVEEIVREPFALAEGRLFRAEVLRLSMEEHIAIVVVHHIVSDGWSTGVLIREVGLLYEAYVQGQPSPLPALEVQYADYALWQRGWLQGEALDRQAGYWKGRLRDAPAALELPTDRPRPVVQSFRGSRHDFALPKELTASLNEFARSEGATLFMVLLAAFQVLLSRWSGQEDIVVGTPIAGRTHREVEGLIGFFVNTLALRTDLSGDASIPELLRQVRETTLEAYAHQDLPFEKLVEELQPVRDLSRQPVFQVLMALQNVPQEILDLPGLRLSRYSDRNVTAKFDLSFYLHEMDGGLQGYFEYASDLFDASTIERLARHFRVLLEGIVARPQARLSELTLMSTGERRQLVEEWNTTAADYPKDCCVHELFAEQAARTPDAVAVVFEDERLSYGELDRRSNQLAWFLRKLGAGPDVIVGLCVERSLEMVVGLLGILKAGAAYLPLDPDYPAERLAYMLSDAKVPLVVTAADAARSLPEHRARAVQLDTDWPAIAQMPDAVLESEVEPGNLAYVIYTSGSTGKPKGVMGVHSGTVNRLTWGKKQFPNQLGEVYCINTSLAFVDSVVEVFGPLTEGGQGAILPQGEERDVDLFAGFLKRKNITRLTLVPSLLNALLGHEKINELERLRLIFCSGEQLLPEAGLHFERKLRTAGLVNVYGSSEVAADATMWHWHFGDAVLIGRPISNTRVYVLDESQEVVPVGVRGELYIGGVGLARGYLGRADLTAERFVPSPFVAGERLYRTGDAARWRSDGNLEYLGRLDHQVKIRGYRIELGEIEVALRSQAAVSDAVVVAREDAPGDKRLVAYVVERSSEAAAIEVGDLRSHLKQSLPDYMVPAHYVFMPALPRLPNGKLDRRALPAPEGRAEGGSGYVAPRTPVEEVLAGLWGEVLQVDRIGASDNFFELGGHSLLATRVVARIRDAFQIELPLRVLFEAPNVAELALRVEAVQREGLGLVAPPLVAGERPAVLPLSYAQERLWFWDRLYPLSATYNEAMAVCLEGMLNISVLKRCFRDLIDRHEILRTRFVMSDGEGIQVIDPVATFELDVIDFSLTKASEQEAQIHTLMQAERGQLFDLERGPLFRVLLLRQATEKHVLLIIMHHIVWDAWSARVLRRELGTLYTRFLRGQPSNLPPLVIQYADYALWQRKRGQDTALERQLVYWRKQLLGAPAALNLPTDHPRPIEPSFSGGNVALALSSELSTALIALGHRRGATLYMVLLAAFQLLLSRWSGQDDIVVGTPIAGRTQRYTEELIGFFVNTLVLRASFSGDPSFDELLDQVKETALGAFAHQDIPFEMLVAKLQTERDRSRQALFQVMFTLMNVPEERVDLFGLPQFSQLEVPQPKAKFDLSLTLVKTANGLTGSIDYAKDLFEHGTIERLLGHFRILLEAIVAAPSRQISELSLLSEAERHQLSMGWNETVACYPENKCVHELFEEQVKRTPAAVALVFGDASLTYKELSERSNQLAEYLQKKGVNQNKFVLTLLPEGPDLVIAWLGILKSGAAFVPISIHAPKQRVIAALRDFGNSMIVTLERYTHAIASPKERIAVLECIPSSSGLFKVNEFGNTGAMYAMYTSGSTGMPKCIVIPHAGIVNRLAWMTECIGVKAAQSVIKISNHIFDPSIWQIFWPLINGGKTIIIDSSQYIDPSIVMQNIQLHKVTIINFVPSVFSSLQDSFSEATEGIFSSIECVIFGGEEISNASLKWLRSRSSARIINLYGPTEVSIGCVFFDVQNVDEERIPIGKPISNIQAFVMTSPDALAPIGVMGELYLGGVGLAHGYWGRADLTAERFVPSPFGLGERLYRTGDLARRRPDGNIEFWGRLDHQVKIRGYRIELGEIEAALLTYASIKQAIVVARDEETYDKRIVAYVVCAEGHSLSVAQLRSYLRHRLPTYMVPSAIVVLERFPLTANGKIDRNALHTPEPHQVTTYVPPQSATEKALTALWAEILGVDRVSAADNFFDIGGHSLIAVRAAVRLGSKFGIDFPLRMLFETPVLCELAESIDRVLCRSPGVHESIKARKPSAPLVALRRSSGQPATLFCVHPVGGGVHCYSDFAKEVGEQISVYGLQALGLDKEQLPIQSIPDMADYYLQHIRTIQPRGPYMLMGWSFGGVVAYEMACQLRRAKDNVKFLGLVDSSYPSASGQYLANSEAAHWRAFVYNILNLSNEQLSNLDQAIWHLPLDQKLNMLMEQLEPTVTETRDENWIKYSHNVFDANRRAWRNYLPNTFDGRITLFQPMQGAVTREDISKWQGSARFGCDTIGMEGDHYSALKAPFVTAIAKAVLRIVDGQQNARTH